MSEENQQADDADCDTQPIDGPTVIKAAFLEFEEFRRKHDWFVKWAVPSLVLEHHPSPTN